MKSVHAFLALGVFLMGCTTPPEKRTEVAVAAPVIAALKEYRFKHSTYPAALDELGLPAAVTAEFERRGIHYHPHIAGTAYTMGFYPPGPVFLCAYGEGFTYSEPRWSCTYK